MSLLPRITAILCARPWRPTAISRASLMLGCVGMMLWSGCQATTHSRMKPVSMSGSQTPITMVADRDEKPEDEKKDGDWNIKGPTERMLSGKRWQQQKETAIAQGNASAIDGLPEYQAAEDLYNAGKYKEAEKAFKALAKERRASYETFQVKWDRWLGIKNAAKWDPYSNFGDPIEEDSLFMLGEAQFAQKRYAYAQDSYDDLLNRYPSTRHMDDVTRKLFRIARYWLDFQEDIDEKGNMQQTVAAAEQRRQQKVEQRRGRIAVIPNFTDRSRPTFDTDGRALQALRSIWLHDTTGPLADDALMLSANYHLRTGDFTESARLYKLLREQYPDSQHFQDAFMLGAHVTLASYQGPGYDGKTLDEAIKLKESALRIFPDLTDEERDRLAGELRRMYDAEVERIWNKVEFYEAKNSPKSVALYCNLLIHKYPESPYADRCRKILASQLNSAERRSEIAGWLPGQGEKPLPRPTPEEQREIDATPPERDEQPRPAKEAEKPPEKPKEPRRFPFTNPLRRVPKAPEAQEPEREEYSPRPVAPASADDAPSGSASLDDE